MRLLVLFFIISLPAISQKLAIGAMGGYQGNRVYFNVNQFLESDFYFGPSGGIMVKYLNDKNQGMLTGLQVSNKGYIQLERDFGESFIPGYKVENTYLEMPLLTYITIGKKTFYMTLMAGPFVGYRLTTNFIGNETERFDQNDFQAGFAGGIGLLFRIKNQEIGINALYVNHLTNLYNQQLLEPIEQTIIQGLSVNLVYFIGVKDWSSL